MSIEFSLTGSSLTLEDWDTFLDEANDWELNEHSDPAFSESGGAHFMVEGSVRGVVLYHEGRRVLPLTPLLLCLALLGALSSRADWRAAYALAAKALGKGGGSLEREDGTKLTLADLTPEKANECGEIDLVASVQMVGNMMADHAAKAAAGDDDAIAEMALPLGRFSLESLENVLAGRVARYSTSYHSMTMNLEGGVKVSTWAQINTVIGNGAHLIACSAFDTEAEGLIPAERLLALLPGRAELLGGGGLFLPEIDLEAEAELRAALEQELVSVEVWAEANKEVLAKEREAAEAASEASEWESYRGLLMFVMGGVSEGNEPQAVAAKLEERGVPQDVARNMVSLIGVSLEHLFDDEGPRDPNLALGELVEKGIPEGLAMVAIDVIVSGMIPPEGAGEGGETA